MTRNYILDKAGCVMKLRTILLFWLVGSTLIMIYSFTDNPEWSFGDVAQVVVASLVILGTIVMLGRQWYKTAFPLRMFFASDWRDPFLVGHARRMDTSVEVKVGQQDIILRIMPTSRTEFGRIGLRCVNRVWLRGQKHLDGKRRFLIGRYEGKWRFLWYWINVPADTIEVTNLQDMELSDTVVISPQKFEEKLDGQGERWGEYYPPYIRAIEDSLWIKATIDAKKDWHGHLSFQGTEVRSPHRSYVRRSFTVVSTPDKEDSQKQ